VEEDDYEELPFAPAGFSISYGCGFGTTAGGQTSE
jgi:hypothetical protein